MICTFAYRWIYLTNNRIETGVPNAHDTIPHDTIPPDAKSLNTIPSPDAISHDTIPFDAKSHDTISTDAKSYNAIPFRLTVCHNAIPHDGERSRCTSTCTSGPKSQEEKEGLGLVLLVGLRCVLCSVMFLVIQLDGSGTGIDNYYLYRREIWKALG